MEFKKLKTDALTIFAELVKLEAAKRDPMLAMSLRNIDLVQDGRYGEDRPDVLLTIALAPGVEASFVNVWCGADASASLFLDDVVELVDAAERIFSDRSATIEMLKGVRSTLTKEVSKARRRGLPCRTTDVQLTTIDSHHDDLPSVKIGIEVIGPMLDLSRVEFDAESVDDVSQVFASMRERQEERLMARNSLASLGADVFIDPVTLAALEDAGVDPAEAIADLQESDIKIVDIDVKYGRMVFYVSNGVITGNVPLGEDMRWTDGRLEIPKTRGLSLKGIKGEPLNRILAHDYFRDDTTIAYATEVGGCIWLNLHVSPVALILRERQAAA